MAWLQQGQDGQRLQSVEHKDQETSPSPTTPPSTATTATATFCGTRSSSRAQERSAPRGSARAPRARPEKKPGANRSRRWFSVTTPPVQFRHAGAFVGLRSRGSSRSTFASGLTLRLDRYRRPPQKQQSDAFTGAGGVLGSPYGHRRDQGTVRAEPDGFFARRRREDGAF